MIDVVMPQMGESIVEGTLTKWTKKVGEKIERDEPLFEISTDKVDTEIPSPAAGVVAEILAQEGQTVAINTVVARIDETGGAAASAPQPAATAPAAPPPAQPAAAPSAPPPPPPPPRQAGAPVAEVAAQAAIEEHIEPLHPVAETHREPEGPLSPLVRRMARENNVDLGLVKGTGAGGRITKQDVEQYLAGKSAAPAPAPKTAPAAVAPLAPAPQREALAPVPPSQAAKLRIEPLSTMRSKIAEHMVASKRISAHVTTVHRVDMTKVAKLRARYKDEVKNSYGFSLTFLPFVVRAAAAALRAFPIVNASLDGNNIIYHQDVNIGIAVALENGLIVPVIRNADEKSVLGLQRSIADLANRARSRQLKPDEVAGGTFSITNFGSFGSVFATPIINQPQVAILGVGAVEKVPVVLDDAIAIRSQAYLALTFDHRIIDGALADQFTGKAKSILENWSEEVL
jgi:2-oxoglutarate dehydrogenase E2 component (dihydrolipoamide succinyltransferase)